MTPRELVVFASEGNHSASEWFLKDEFGSWEKQAAEMLELTAARRAELEAVGVARATLEAEMANQLKLRALRALMEELKRRPVEAVNPVLSPAPATPTFAWVNWFELV